MKEIVGSTAEEKRLIKAIQKAGGALDNGVIGTDTMITIAILIGALKEPVAVEMYSQPTVVAPDLIPFDPNGAIKNYQYTVSGSFTQDGAPCSILVNRGKVVFGQSCHYWTTGRPESVLYKLNDGSLWVKRVHQVSELPGGVKWAVGGMGLLDNWNPQVEGFDGDQIGVQRKTGHVVLGYKLGYVYGVCFKNHTAAEVNRICRDNFKFKGAIMLDGGTPFAYNLAHMTYGLTKPCGYALQFTRRD